MIGGRCPPVEAYLAWLSRIERSPNTVCAYAQDLKAFWEFLAARWRRCGWLHQARGGCERTWRGARTGVGSASPSRTSR